MAETWMTLELKLPQTYMTLEIFEYPLNRGSCSDTRLRFTVVQSPGFCAAQTKHYLGFIK
ncbi:uncharacterized protein RAG0_06627 [Rhynchosporium agropyri]|uniref:Uncharacterized protein n=1 Tax=Rhynchosporium agropyri TaxID=914238 RepID=A0A1E1KI58_9HELO|nr:uncharacterized protein RAG0_06627 [Rhynchosporium agropyri]